MDATISSLSLRDWVPLGIGLKKAANRKSDDRGKRSVAELAPNDGGPRPIMQRDGHYRPEDGTAEYLTFWAATSKGWSQVGAFHWNEASRTWETVDHAGPRPD